jgi:phytoene dehydrogenase-like protein
MFDKKVVILEKHVISGGLNSYYSRRNKETKEMIDLDVGLHALTNFATRGEKGKPLTKLLKQLRIPYGDLNLKEQSYSLIKFKSASIKFSNDFEMIKNEVACVFPSEIDSFVKFSQYVATYNEVDLNAPYVSARAVLDQYFNEELLKEMIIAPLLIYGSAWEHDMDFSQFVIMFKSLYFEGFSRPVGGVRTILDLLLEKFKSLGGELLFRTEVESIEDCGAIKKVVLAKACGVLEAKTILSSAGIVETKQMIKGYEKPDSSIGKLSFLESIFLVKEKKSILDFGATIVFYNKSDRYSYRQPNNAYDLESAVFCLPDNYERDYENRDDGIIRVTNMANYHLWKSFDKQTYRKNKELVFFKAKELGECILGTELNISFKDIFSPTTIERYTSHRGGTVYGSPDKVKNGKIGIPGIYIIGTDQGFLGIVGSMLSGISMANLYGLMDER